MTSISVIPKLDFPSRYPDAKSTTLIYEELAELWRVFEKASQLPKEKLKKYKRIILLGKAFKTEMSPLSEMLYLTWLFGPNLNSFDKLPFQKNDSLKSKYGRRLTLGDSTLPWMRIDWSQIQTKAIKQILDNSFEFIEKKLESKDLEAFAVDNLKREINKVEPYKGAFGSYHRLSLEKPRTYIMSPRTNSELSISTYEQLWNEKGFGNAFLLGGNSLTTLLVLFLSREVLLGEYSRGNMPDIVSSLGGINLYGYGKGTYEIKEVSGKKKAIFQFQEIGIRIVDPYDFSGWQPLGCWYPEKGHDLSSIKFSYDLSKMKSHNGKGELGTMISTFTQCTLTNSDFREFKEDVRVKFNNISPNYRLTCQDYYLVTPVKNKAVNIQYEIDL